MKHNGMLPAATVADSIRMALALLASERKTEVTNERGNVLLDVAISIALIGFGLILWVQVSRILADIARHALQSVGVA